MACIECINRGAALSFFTKRASKLMHVAAARWGRFFPSSLCTSSPDGLKLFARTASLWQTKRLEDSHAAVFRTGNLLIGMSNAFRHASRTCVTPNVFDRRTTASGESRNRNMNSLEGIVTRTRRFWAFEPPFVASIFSAATGENSLLVIALIFESRAQLPGTNHGLPPTGLDSSSGRPWVRIPINPHQIKQQSKPSPVDKFRMDGTFFQGSMAINQDSPLGLGSGGCVCRRGDGLGQLGDRRNSALKVRFSGPARLL